MTKRSKNKKKGGKNSNAPPLLSPPLSNDNATSDDEGSFQGNGSNPPSPEKERRNSLNEILITLKSEFQEGKYSKVMKTAMEVLESMSKGEKKKYGASFALIINNSIEMIAKKDERCLNLGEITLSLNLLLETLVMGDSKDAQLMARDRVMKLTYEMIENATKFGTNRPKDMDICLRLLSDCTRWCLGDTPNQAEDNINAINRLGKAQEMVAAGFSSLSPDAEKSWYILGDGRCAVRLIIFELTRGGKVITIGGLQSNPKTDYRRDNSMETRKFLAAAFVAYAKKNLEYWKTRSLRSDADKEIANALVSDTGEGNAQYSYIGQAEDQVELYTNALSDGSLLKAFIPYKLWAIDAILLGASELHEEKVEVHVNGRHRYGFGEKHSSGSSIPIILNNVCDNGGQGIHFDLQYHPDKSVNPDVHKNYVPPEPAFEEGDRVRVTVPDANGEEEEVFEGTVVGYDAVYHEYFVDFVSQDVPQQAFSEHDLTRVGGDNGGGRSAEQVVVDRMQHKKVNGTWLRRHEKTERSERYNEKYPDGPSNKESTTLPTPKHADIPSSTVKCLDTANTLYTEGKKCQADNNHDEAIDKFISALDHTPLEDVQLARAIELDLAQSMYHRYETVPSKLVEALAILDDHLRHREGSEKSRSLHLAVSIHLSIMQNEDTSNLESILSSYQHLTTYIEHLRTDDTLPLDTNYNLTQMQEDADNKLAELISRRDDVDESLPDSLKLLSMCTINKTLVKRAGELSAADSSTLEPHLQSVQDYMPLLDKLYKLVKTKQDGGSISGKVVDGLVRDAKQIDDSIVASVNNVKDKEGNSSIANTSEPVNKNASNIQLSNYSPWEDAGFVATNSSRVAVGNKLDREGNLCMNKIGQLLPRSLSRGAGVNPSSVVNDELAEQQVHFDACITVIDKPEYDNEEEPAGFITCSGCRDEQDYYLPTACKVAVQIAIRFISSGKLSVLTSWSKEGGDNILEVNGANLSPLVMVMGRLPHPDYMRDPERLIKSRRHFTKYNRTLTGSYSALGIMCPSVGDTYEYHAGCKNWTEEDYKEQAAAEHKSRFFGGITNSILRREGLDFIDEYTSNHKNDGSEDEVLADALAKLRTLSVTHANLVGGGITSGEYSTLATTFKQIFQERLSTDNPEQDAFDHDMCEMIIPLLNKDELRKYNNLLDFNDGNKATLFDKLRNSSEGSAKSGEMSKLASELDKVDGDYNKLSPEWKSTFQKHMTRKKIDEKKFTKILTGMHDGKSKGGKKGGKTSGEMSKLASELDKVDGDYNKLSPEWQFIFDLHMARKKIDKDELIKILNGMHDGSSKGGKNSTGGKTNGEMKKLASVLKDNKVDGDYNKLSPEWQFIFDLHMARKKMDKTSFRSYLLKLNGHNFKGGKTDEEYSKQCSTNSRCHWDKVTQREIKDSNGWAVTLSCPNKGKGCTFTRTKGLNAYNKMKDPRFRCKDCKEDKVGGWTETKPFQVKVKDDSSKQTTLSEPTKKRGSKTSTDTSQKETKKKKTSTDTSQKEPTKKRGNKTSTDTTQKETKKKKKKTSTDKSQKKSITTKREKATSTTKKLSAKRKNESSTTTQKKMKQSTISLIPQNGKGKRKSTPTSTSTQPKKQKKTDKKKERWECTCLNENDLKLTRCSFCGKPRA